jgi:protein gp37
MLTVAEDALYGEAIFRLALDSSVHLKRVFHLRKKAGLLHLVEFEALYRSLGRFSVKDIAWTLAQEKERRFDKALSNLVEGGPS